jgi:hypothetical protein
LCEVSAPGFWCSSTPEGMRSRSGGGRDGTARVGTPIVQQANARTSPIAAIPAVRLSERREVPANATRPHSVGAVGLLEGAIHRRSTSPSDDLAPRVPRPIRITIGAMHSPLDAAVNSLWIDQRLRAARRTSERARHSDASPPPLERWWQPSVSLLLVTSR